MTKQLISTLDGARTLWEGQWLGDLDGLYETRAIVTSEEGCLFAHLEVSFQGGEPRISTDESPASSLDHAIEKAKALGELWHRNNSDLY